MSGHVIISITCLYKHYYVCLCCFDEHVEEGGGREKRYEKKIVTRPAQPGPVTGDSKQTRQPGLSPSQGQISLSVCWIIYVPFITDNNKGIGQTILFVAACFASLNMLQLVKVRSISMVIQ